MLPTHLEKYDLFAALRLWQTTWVGENPKSKQWGVFVGRRLMGDGDYAVGCRLECKKISSAMSWQIVKYADTPEEAVWLAIKKFDEEMPPFPPLVPAAPNVPEV